MSNIIVDVEQAATKFGSWIENEFSAANKLYNELTEVEKEGATWAYGIIAIVNKNLTSEGALIIPIIQKVFPTLSLSVVQGFVDTLLKDVNAVVSDTPLTLEDALTELAKYLSSFHGSAWEQISQALGNLLAIAFAPETPIQKFIQIAELVYQGIVKPLLA